MGRSKQKYSAPKRATPLLDFFEGNFLAPFAVMIPVGLLIAFAQFNYPLPMWPAVVLPVAGTAAIFWLNLGGTLTRKKRMWADAGLGALSALAICLVERPWLDSFDHKAQWPHAIGVAYGLATATLLISLVFFAAWKLKKRGPFSNLVTGGPYVMVVVSTFGVGIMGILIGGLSFFFWDEDLAYLAEGFLPPSVFITLLACMIFAGIGAFLSWVQSAEGGGGGGGYTGSAGSSGGYSGGYSGGGGSSSSYDDD